MDMSNLIFNILMALVVTIAGIIAKQLLPYLREKEAEAMERIRQTRWAWCADIIDSAVRAIEQTIGEDIHGEEKKAAAVQLIQRIFYQSGLRLTDDQIDALVEAAVQQMNSSTIEIETEGSMDESL